MIVHHVRKVLWALLDEDDFGILRQGLRVGDHFGLKLLVGFSETLLLETTTVERGNGEVFAPRCSWRAGGFRRRHVCGACAERVRGEGAANGYGDHDETNPVINV